MFCGYRFSAAVASIPQTLVVAHSYGAIFAGRPQVGTELLPNPQTQTIAGIWGNKRDIRLLDSLLPRTLPAELGHSIKLRMVSILLRHAGGQSQFRKRVSRWYPGSAHPHY
jgi:hypothetical protein